MPEATRLGETADPDGRVLISRAPRGMGAGCIFCALPRVNRSFALWYLSEHSGTDHFITTPGTNQLDGARVNPGANKGHVAF